MKGFYIIGLILSTSICAGATPVNAQSKALKVNTNYLPKADKIYPANLKINIIDPTPQITDNRSGQASSVYIIPINPVPTSQDVTTILLPGGSTGQAVTPIGVPGGPLANQFGHAGRPAAIMINPNKLPAARFDSNIPAKMGPTAHLPQGTSTAGLRGRLLTPQAGAQQIGKHAKEPMPIYGMGDAPTAIRRGPGVAVYAPIGSGSTSSERLVRTEVSGKITRRMLMNSK